jgi:DNA-binding transcriptional ArsR family regulator
LGVDALAEAIGDPVRRRILELLRERPLPAGQIAAQFPISRPAVSRHLRVLRECGLVRDSLDGRHRVYALEPSALSPLITWLSRLVSAFPQALDALETEVQRTRRARPSSFTQDHEERSA